MKNMAYRFVPIAVRSALLALLLTLAAPHLVAAEPGATSEKEKTYVRPGYPLWPPLYRAPGPCLPSGACAGLWLTDRQKPRRPVAPDKANQADPDIWGTTGSPWGYVRRLPPPTSEGQIQPRYRDASTLRADVGEPADSAPR
jgi:hypothetical protein